jgi:hypothetical protein
VPQAGHQKRTDYTGLIILAIVAPVYVLFIYLDKEELGRSVAIALGMTMVAIRVRWDDLPPFSAQSIIRHPLVLKG